MQIMQCKRIPDRWYSPRADPSHPLTSAWRAGTGRMTRRAGSGGTPEPTVIVRIKEGIDWPTCAVWSAFRPRKQFCFRGFFSSGQIRVCGLSPCPAVGSLRGFLFLCHCEGGRWSSRRCPSAVHLHRHASAVSRPRPTKQSLVIRGLPRPALRLRFTPLRERGSQ